MAASPRRVLVCPQEFKGSLDPFDATTALARGVRAALPTAEVIERPLADGGPGTAAIIAAATGGHLVSAAVRGAYGAPTDASYALAELDGARVAFVESATAIGLVLTPPGDRRPAIASSEGVGDLLLHAARAGAQGIIVGVGGTGTSDGGSGVARALGLRLLDAAGHDLPPGCIHLVRLARVEDATTEAIRALDVRIAVDVQNPLTGPAGAIAVYGRQKGLADWQAPALDAALRRWAERVRADLGRDVEAPGAGAGGGIPAGVLAAVPHSSIESGAALIADLVGLASLIASVDLVVTGEGALDAQTAYGKTVGHVAELAADAGVPCIAVAGVVEGVPRGILDTEALAASPTEMEDAMRHAANRAEQATRRLLERWGARPGA